MVLDVFQVCLEVILGTCRSANGLLLPVAFQVGSLRILWKVTISSCEAAMTARGSFHPETFSRAVGTIGAFVITSVFISILT